MTILEEDFVMEEGLQFCLCIPKVVCSVPQESVVVLRTIAAYCNGRHRTFTDAPQSNVWHFFVLERSTFQTPAVPFILLVYFFFLANKFYNTTASVTPLPIYVIRQQDWSHWPRGLRLGSATFRLVRLRVRIPPGECVSVPRADHSSRGVLLSVECLSVMVKKI